VISQRRSPSTVAPMKFVPTSDSEINAKPSILTLPVISLAPYSESHSIPFLFHLLLSALQVSVDALVCLCICAC